MRLSGRALALPPRGPGGLCGPGAEGVSGCSDGHEAVDDVAGPLAEVEVSAEEPKSFRGLVYMIVVKVHEEFG